MPISDPHAIKAVSSNQSGIHEYLDAIVAKHLHSTFQRPISNHTQQAFEHVAQQVIQHNAPLIFDSGCGTALSTRHIAQQYPAALVIGIDRSEVRLNKQYEQALPDNALTVRADLVDFWRLAQTAGWQLQRHFILYPNPYPKSVHIKRRWHAHPVLPSLLALGGEIELRTNWQIYAAEFAHTLCQTHYAQVQAQQFVPQNYWTLFERKYFEAGQTLYRVNSTETQA